MAYVHELIRSNGLKFWEIRENIRYKTSSGLLLVLSVYVDDLLFETNYH